MKYLNYKIYIIIIIVFFQKTAFSQVEINSAYVKIQNEREYQIDNIIPTEIEKSFNDSFEYTDEVIISGEDGQGIIEVEVSNGEIKSVTNLNTFFSYEFYSEPFEKYLHKSIKNWQLNNDKNYNIVLIVNFYLKDRKTWNNPRYDKERYLNEVEKELSELNELKNIPMKIISKLNSLSNYDPLCDRTNEIWFDIFTAQNESEFYKERIEKLVDIKKSFNR